MDPKNIRNFCIIAHIDHGKSTLADRFLELTKAVEVREMRAQYLDNMDLERERGITIKAQTVRLNYTAKDGQLYEFNLIDTPGHVDFTYEVSRSITACEGAILVVDASQGVEAQTIANTLLALEHGLEVIPVLNKIDLPAADPERVKNEIEEILGLDAGDSLKISAKSGSGVAELLEQIVKKIPAPKSPANSKLKALIFDSWFDPYIGVITLVRVMSGSIRKDMNIRLMASARDFEVLKLGVFTPKPLYMDVISEGEVGFIAAGMKDLSEARVGDTITNADDPADEPLPGFKPAKQMVFCGFYPIDTADYDNLRDSLDKLHLNDAAFSYERDNSEALGFGFRCGFLGLLHMDIVQERLEREFGIQLITTAPSVVYRILMTDGEVMEIENPSKMPNPSEIEEIEEPYIRAHIHTPNQYLGGLLSLCTEKRGQQVDMICYQNARVQLIYDLPLAEVMYDFYDSLKSISRGYASMDYELVGYKSSSLVKLDILINGKTVDALSTIVHKDNSYYRGRDLVSRLRSIIERQMYEVAIQAAIGGKIIARETVKAMRKDVLAKCYGGDITRKRKLLEKQKEGKKRMKNVGSVEIPQEAFLAVLKVK